MAPQQLPRQYGSPLWALQCAIMANQTASERVWDLTDRHLLTTTQLLCIYIHERGWQRAAERERICINKRMRRVKRDSLLWFESRPNHSEAQSQLGLISGHRADIVFSLSPRHKIDTKSSWNAFLLGLLKLSWSFRLIPEGRFYVSQVHSSLWFPINKLKTQNKEMVYSPKRISHKEEEGGKKCPSDMKRPLEQTQTCGGPSGEFPSISNPG